MAGKAEEGSLRWGSDTMAFMAFKTVAQLALTWGSLSTRCLVRVGFFIDHYLMALFLRCLLNLQRNNSAASITPKPADPRVSIYHSIPNC